MSAKWSRNKADYI